MKIGIIGSAPSSLELAPYLDAQGLAPTAGPMIHPPPVFATEQWELWGCSPALFGQQRRINEWFELHRWEPGKQWFSPEYCAWLRAFKGKVWVGGEIPEIPNAVRYPIWAVEAEFSSYFLTSSVALMMALAILRIEEQWAIGALPRDQGTIGLWGIDMAASEEWNEQRPGCQFFVLEALRRGIEVYLPPESDLLRPMPVYGLSEWDHQYIKGVARMRELQGKLKHHREAVAANMANQRYIEGAIDDLNWEIKTWCSPYGLPHGKFLKHQPNTGLGGGPNTHYSVSDEPAKPVQPAGMVARIDRPTVAGGMAKPYTGRVKTDG